MEETPLNELKLSSSEFLKEIDKRTACRNCNKTRKYYCYNCCLVLPGLEEKIPKVKLPIKVDIIKHPNERDGKSTAVHAAVIASEDVKIYTYPVIPDFDNSDKVVLVYPGDYAVSLAELAELRKNESLLKKTSATSLSPPKYCGNNSKQNGNESAIQCGETKSQGVESEDEHSSSDNDHTSKTALPDGGKCQASVKRLCDDEEESSKRVKVSERPFDRVVFIDSTWSQTKKIYDDERIRDLPQVKLESHKTVFWRHQKDKPDTYLATIEAIYYFLREYHEQFLDEPYQGQYDDLLFFFCFLYKQTRELYEGGRNIKAYKDRENRGIMM